MGSYYAVEKQLCPTCNGVGKVPNSAYPYRKEQLCPSCTGTKYVLRAVDLEQAVAEIIKNNNSLVIDAN